MIRRFILAVGLSGLCLLSSPAIAGAAAVIVILVSALRFALSGSDISTNSRTDTDVENARHTLVNALIGLAVIVLARQIILFVLGKT
jgi:lysylphosphatidylglycerol synthetase-like protein (DUF2156 family)